MPHGALATAAERTAERAAHNRLMDLALGDVSRGPRDLEFAGVRTVGRLRFYRYRRGSETVEAGPFRVGR